MDALTRWAGPAENHVYADTQGNIGYQPAGLFPRRENFDGLLPVPGDGQYEWNGFFAINVLPSEFNPDRGFIATANAMTLPPDYPIDKYRIGFEWSSPWRQRRIENVLQRQRKHTLRNSIALQHDYQSVFAEQMLKKIPRRLPNTIKEMFEGWDGGMDARSSSAAFFAIWYTRHLVPALIETLFGSVTPIKSLSSSAVLELMDNKAYDELVVTSLVITQISFIPGASPFHMEAKFPSSNQSENKLRIDWRSRAETTTGIWSYNAQFLSLSLIHI